MGRRRSDIEEDGYVWHKYGAKNVRGRKVEGDAGDGSPGQFTRWAGLG